MNKKILMLLFILTVSVIVGCSKVTGQEDSETSVSIIQSEGMNDEIEEWNFKTITDETSFYVNEKDNVVISFNEGEVAPMYMGVVEFEIPADVLSDIRK